MSFYSRQTDEREREGAFTVKSSRDPLLSFSLWYYLSTLLLISDCLTACLHGCVWLGLCCRDGRPPSLGWLAEEMRRMHASMTRKRVQHLMIRCVLGAGRLHGRSPTRETDRPADRQTDRQTGWQTDRHQTRGERNEANAFIAFIHPCECVCVCARASGACSLCACHTGKVRPSVGHESE